MLAGLAAGLLLAGGQALAVDKDVVVDYGATPNSNPPDDDKAAFTTALNDIISQGGGTLTVPPGKYHFSGRVEVDLKRMSNGTAVAVSILGAGRGVTQLYAANQAGIFYFHNSLPNSQVEIVDLAFVADRGEKLDPVTGIGTGSVDTSGNTHSGTAVQIDNPSLTSYNICSLRMERVAFQGANWNSHQLNRYFKNGLWATNLKNPVLNDVYSRSLYGEPGQPETGWRLLGNCGFYINGAHNVTLTNCYSKQANRCISLENVTGPVVVDRCVTTGGDVGLYLKAKTPQACTLSLLAGQFNQTYYGAEIHDAGQVIVRDFTCYVSEWHGMINTTVTPNVSEDPEYRDLYLDNSFPAFVGTTIFHAWPRSVRTDGVITLYGRNRRVCVELTGGNIDAAVRRCVFNGNTALSGLPENSSTLIAPNTAVRVRGASLIQPNWTGTPANSTTSVSGATVSQSIYNKNGQM